MRDDRPISPAYSPSLTFAIRCLELFKTTPVAILNVLRRKSLQRKLVCFAVAVNLLIWPGPGLLAQDLADGVSRALDVRFASSSYEAYALRSFYSGLLSLFSSPAAQHREDTQTRSLRVRAIELSPDKRVGYLNERVGFAAVGKDASGNTVQGARFNWSSSDEQILRIDDSGQATLIAPGLVWVTASAPLASNRAPVLVRPAARTVQTDDQWKADQDQLRPDGSLVSANGRPAGGDERLSTDNGGPGGIGALVGSLIDKLAPTVHAQTGGGDSGDFLYDELWSEPRNLVGSPRNRAMDSTRIGPVLPEGSNFEFSVPIISLPGRGVPLGLSMNYNSRIWSRHGSAVTFNAVNTWPYLGFTLSFGRIVTYGSDPNTKFMLIDSDGTRRYLGTGVSNQTNTLQTNDGSHITYVGTATSGSLYYNNGIRISVGLVNNRLLVNSVLDPNGNFLSISYANQPTPCQDNSGKVG